MKSSGLIAMCLVLVAGSTASARERFIYRPVSVSFVPGFSTNGQEYLSVASNLSLNVIGGSIGRVHGVELGGVFDIDRDDVIGFQAAGVLNTVGGVFAGAQLAGAFNVANQGVFGYQAAGVFNTAGNQSAGIQQAGVFNVVAEKFTGLQMAGVANAVAGEFRGAQMAGVANVNGVFGVGVQVAGVANVAVQEMSGLQLSGVVNGASEFSGAQVGVINIAGRGHGVQLGVVNIAQDVDVPIGLLSIVRDGQFHVNVWASEVSLLNVGLKTGSRTIYNIFAFGVQPTGDSTRLLAGLGMGGHIPFSPFFLDIAGTGYNVYSSPHWINQDRLNLLSRLDFTGGWQVSDNLAVIAGPTMSVWVSDQEDGSAIPLYDAPLYKSAGHTHVRIWPGFTVGIQLL